MVTVVRGPNSEEISYNRFDGDSFFEGPIEGWSIITALGGSAPGCCLGNTEEIDSQRPEPPARDPSWRYPPLSCRS